MNRLLGSLVLVFLLGACSAERNGTRSETPSPDAPQARRPPVAAAELVQLSSAPREEPPASLGVSGVNKPNGLEYRLRQSVPEATPAFIPREIDGLVLWIADRAPEGWLAFYREPLEMRPGGENARYRALLFDEKGELSWDRNLNRFLSRPTQLEIQDIRLHGGRLYFNEACQTYSREAGGECSALVRLNPGTGEVDWRTRHRMSNDIFILHDPYVVSGYGFTAEPDSLFLIAQTTGEIVARHALDTAHSYLEVVGDDLVVITRNRVYRFRLPR